MSKRQEFFLLLACLTSAVLLILCLNAGGAR